MKTRLAKKIMKTYMTETLISETGDCRYNDGQIESAHRLIIKKK